MAGPVCDAWPRLAWGEGTVNRQEKLRVIAEAHERWVETVLPTVADDGPTGYRAHHPGGQSDYVQHLADMEATPEQEQALIDEIAWRTQ